MLNHVEVIFEDMQPMMKRLKKASYETNMEAFRKQHGAIFTEMLDSISASDDKKQAADSIAAEFTEQIKTAFSMRGKINSRTQADINFFMIYYVFPAILLTGDENARMLCDSIRDKWRVTFRDSKNLDYADYDRIHNAFREKIFGIF